MDGIIIVDKPAGWTSFDVVAKIRNVTREQKVGHSGTLDPLATGLLPIFLGKATKTIQYFLNGDKGYEGEMILGAKTDTGDADGKVIMTNDQGLPLCGIPQQYKIKYGSGTISNEVIIETFKKFIGAVEQVPPMYSAVKVKGKRLYELARKGLEVKREPRRIQIYELQLKRFWKPENELLGSQNQVNRDACPDFHIGVQSQVYKVSFSVTCSKGTYVRQLAVDIGDDLGCGAFLSSLCRTYAHPFHLAQALPLETIVTLAKVGKLSTVILQPEDFLLTPALTSFVPPLSIGDREENKGVRNG